jgi:GT2 family glycosyltransferase
VLVCTRNRARSLSETLQALNRIRFDPLSAVELIIVDNNSSDDTQRTVLDYISQSPVEIVYVQESTPGLSMARNRGIRIARGSVLLFTDDDCIPDVDWVNNIMQAFAGSDYRQVVGGRVELHNPDDVPLTIKSTLTAEELTSHHQVYGFLHGCNMAVGRAVLEEIGAFDVRLGAGTKLRAAEDTDLVYRALKAGVRVTYNPTAVVYHNHGRRTAAEATKLIRDYKTGMGAIAMKNALGGDVDLVKDVYWNLRSAVRDCISRRVKPSYLLTEGRLLLGAALFLAQAQPWAGKLHVMLPELAMPEQAAVAIATQG